MKELFYMGDLKTVSKTRKDYTCFGCGEHIPAGSICTVLPVKDEKKIISLHFCLPCFFCYSMMDRDHRNGLTEMMFSDQKIPNFLRKLRKEFIADMAGTIKKYNLGQRECDQPKPEEKNIMLTGAEINRRILHLRSTKYPVSAFQPGETLHLRAGVRGKRRTVVVQMVRQTTGKGIGKRGKFTGLLVKDKE